MNTKQQLKAANSALHKAILNGASKDEKAILRKRVYDAQWRILEEEGKVEEIPYSSGPCDWWK